jgi:hypothetical protein
MSWHDVNADGWEDLLVTAGHGGRLAAYLSETGRGFRKLEATSGVAGDQTTVLGWADGQGNRRILVATSNFEFPSPGESVLQALAPTNLVVMQSWPAGKRASRR